MHLIGDSVSSILANLLRMVTQSEEILEQGLIKTLQEMNYEYISIKEEDNLYANFKLQLENTTAKNWHCMVVKASQIKSLIKYYSILKEVLASKKQKTS